MGSVARNRENLDEPRDQATLRRTDALGGLELLSATYTRFVFPPHFHEEFMIAVTHDGVGLPWIRGTEHRVGRDDLIVLNPGQVQHGGTAEGTSWRYWGLYPPVQLMQRVARELAGVNRCMPLFARSVVSDPLVVSLLRRAHAAFEDGASVLEGETRLLDALAALVERHAAERVPPHRIGREHRAVRVAREYLHEHPDANVSLDELARETGLSTFHLVRVFRKEVGLSPHAYQILTRVRFAKELLAHGHQISQVALDAGFFDQAHFSRHFKRIFGITPGSYFSTGSPSGG